MPIATERGARGIGAIARSLAWLLLAAPMIGSCSRRSTAEAPAAHAAVPGDLGDSRERSQALIENGNQSFRTGDFALAARRYAAAVVVDPDDPAAYYGLGMALSKLGRDEQARVAYAHARDLIRQGHAPPEMLDSTR